MNPTCANDHSATLSPSCPSPLPPRRPPRSIHRLTPKASSEFCLGLLEPTSPLDLLTLTSPLQEIIDRARAKSPGLVSSESASSLTTETALPAHCNIPSCRQPSLPQKPSLSLANSVPFSNTIAPLVHPASCPSVLQSFVPCINSPGLACESPAGEFATTDDANENVLPQHGSHLGLPFERIQRCAHANLITAQQPARSPTTRTSFLPLQPTLPVEAVQTVRQRLETPLPTSPCQPSDHFPQSPPISASDYNSSALETTQPIFEPVTGSVPETWMGAQSSHSTLLALKKPLITPRPRRLRTSSETQPYLSFPSSSGHSRLHYSTYDCPGSASELDTPDSFEIPSRPLNTPFLTPTYHNNDPDPFRLSPQTIGMARSFSTIGGLAAIRHRQHPDGRRPTSATAFRQLSSLFHPRSRNPSFDSLSHHLIKPKIQPALSTQSIFTLASTTTHVSLTWRNSVARQHYDHLVAEHGSMEMRRQEVIWELGQTEEAYLSSLSTVIEIFVDPLRRADGQWISDVPSPVLSLFESLEEIIKTHTQINQAVKSKEDELLVERIADRWLSHVPKLEVHQSYLAKFEAVNKLLEEMVGDQNSDFGEFVRMQSESDQCGKMSLSSFLLKPVQRLMKYPLFFKQLRDLTPPMHVDHLSTIALLEATDEIIKVMQEVKSREDDYLRIKTLESQIKQFPLPGGLKLAIRDRKLLGQGVLSQVHLLSTNRLAPPLQQREPRPISQFSNESEFGGSACTRTDCSSSCSDEPPKTPLELSDYTTNLIDLAPPPSPLVRKASRLSGPARFLTGNGNTSHKESKVLVSVFSDVMLVLSDNRTLDNPLLRRRTSSKKGSIIEYQLVDEIGICKIIGVEDCSGELGYERMLKVRVYPLMSSEQQQEQEQGSLRKREKVIYFAIQEDKEIERWMKWMKKSGFGKLMKEEVKTLARSESIRQALAVKRARLEERTWWKERFRIVRSEMNF